MNRVLSDALGIANRVIELRREFHMNPEPGFREERTAARIEQALERIGGFRVRRSCGTGIIADIGDATSMLMLRADIDALEIEEESGAPYASQCKGMMHACGHDSHTAMLLGAAELISKNRSSLKKGIRLVFQPCEETNPGGAKALIADGVLDGVEAAIAQHVYPQEEAGTIALKTGAMMANCDDFDCIFIGKAGHAAQPHECRDAIVAASDFVTRIQPIVSRRFDPFDNVVVTVGTLHAGTRRNIVAQEATLKGTIRTLTRESRDLACRLVEQSARASAAQMETGIEFKLDVSYPALMNDPGLVAYIEMIAGGVIGADKIRRMEHPSMGSEDFARYGESIPVCMYRLGSGGDDRTRFGHHHPRFDIDESCLPLGVAILTEAALNWKGVVS